MSDRRDLLGAPKRHTTNLVVVVPALFLFSLMLLSAAFVFGESLKHGASAGRWIGSTSFLLFSIVMVAALIREVALRFDRPRPASRDVSPDAAAERGETKALEFAEPLLGQEDAAADPELSEAVILVLGFRTRSSPTEDYSALARQFGEARARDLASRVGVLLKELASVEVDWSRHTLASGGDEVRAHMATRHPELTQEALKALRWTFTFSWR